MSWNWTGDMLQRFQNYYDNDICIWQVLEICGTVAAHNTFREKRCVATVWHIEALASNNRLRTTECWGLTTWLHIIRAGRKSSWRSWGPCWRRQFAGSHSVASLPQVHDQVRCDKARHMKDIRIEVINYTCGASHVTMFDVFKKCDSNWTGDMPQFP